METRPELTVILPVLNERESLQPLFEELQNSLKQTRKSYELLFVDDGSQDGSLEVLRGLERDNTVVRLVEFEQNAGQSAALGAGFRAAKGKIIVTLDSDGQIDPRDIPKVLEPIHHNKADAVCGVRAMRKDSWIKRKTSQFANWVRNKISGDSIQDTGCSLKAFRKECLDSFFYFNGMHRFFPTLVKMGGYRVVEVPVSHRSREKGESKYSTRNRLIHPFLDLLAVRWMKDKKLRYSMRKQ